MNIKSKIRDAIWWVRHRTTDRYHIIDISGMDGYDKGWIDRDHAMYLACFKLLCDFVEKESKILMTRDVTLADYTSETYQPTGDELECIKNQIDHENEIRAIYLWWKHTRPAEKRAHESVELNSPPLFDVDWQLNRSTEFYESQMWKDYFAEDQRLDEKDDEMLERLMKVRKYLWT